MPTLPEIHAAIEAHAKVGDQNLLAIGRLLKQARALFRATPGLQLPHPTTGELTLFGPWAGSFKKLNEARAMNLAFQAERGRDA